jgi:diaminopimelate epimerase
MRIAKYHGTGNDFVFVEDLADAHPVSPALVRALCDRHGGVGADGLIRVVRGGPAGADFFMDYWNRDGEVAQMCGNGIRCVGKFVIERGFTDRTEIDVETRARVKHLVIATDGTTVTSVTVDMGPPAFELGALPMEGDPAGTFLNEPFEAAGRSWTASAVSMGNPHIVLFLDAEDDLEALDVGRIGPQIEHDPRFPERTNVEFVQAREGRVAMRVWERGSGETMACGTGACAVLVASNLAGLAKRRSEVDVPGGVLSIDWADDDHVFLTGPATFVFEADLDPEWVREAEAAFA